MPSKIKRMAERVKQSLGFVPSGHSEWRATSNLRNQKMILEAKRFAKQVKLMHRDLTMWDKSVEAGLTTMRGVLSTPLPHAYDDTPNGVLPVDQNAGVCIVGTNVSVEALAAAHAEMRERLQAEVLSPLEQWLAAYRTIKERNRRVEQLRLDLDTKRRAATQLAEKYHQLKVKPPKDQSDVDTVLTQLTVQEEKMNKLQAKFSETEGEVFNALLTLITDTTVLREYAAGALLVVQRCFQTSYTAFDLAAPPPMPVLPPAAVPTPALPVSLAASAGNAQFMSASPASAPPPAASAISSGGAPAQQYPSIGGAAAHLTPAPAGHVPAQQHAPGDNPFYSSASPEPVKTPPQPQQHGDHGELPRAPIVPAWYTEAKANARPVTDYSSEDESAPNPFTPASKPHHAVAVPA